jgi:hypothetical protein
MAFTIGHVVTNGPDGTVFYWMRLADGRVETGVGNEAEVAADVTFTHDYATAASLSRGEFTLQEAAFAGRVKVTGRPEALLTSVAATTWIELAAALAPVQAATTY